MKRNRLFFIQIQTLPLSMHHKRKKVLILHANIQWRLGDQLQTKSPIELKGNSLVSDCVPLWPSLRLVAGLVKAEQLALTTVSQP